MTSSTHHALDLDRPSGPPHLEGISTPDPVRWAGDHRPRLRDLVTEHGAVLVRGLDLQDSQTAAAVIRKLAGGLITETEAFAVRKGYAPGVYSSATWPAAKPMCMHHELSYRLDVPGLMIFVCLTPPTSGGATGVADAASVLAALPKDLLRRFDTHGWLLTRNFSDEIGTSVEQAFGTADRAAVERYCRANAIEYQWLDDGNLRTRQRRPAVVRHPQTARRCWVNQVAFLNEWTLEEDVREFLLDMYGSDGLPFNTAFGDGSPIDAGIIDELNAIYEANTRRVPWQAGDLMLVDNISTAHSREAYSGPREVMVAMAEPVRLTAAAEESAT